MGPAEGAGPFLAAVAKKLSAERKTDCFILMVGQRRSGKSWASVKLAEAIGKLTGLPYIVGQHNFFTLDAFLEAINKKRLKERQAITIQELGVNANRRNWYKEANKAFNSIVQVMGIYRLCVISTLPSLAVLDSTQVLLANYLLEADTFPNLRTKRSYFKPRVIAHDPINRKTYFPFFRHREPGKLVPTIVQKISFGVPEQAATFEEMDIAYKKELTKLTQIELRSNIESLAEAVEMVKRNADKVTTIRKTDGRRIFSSSKLRGLGLSSGMAARAKFFMEHGGEKDGAS